MATDDGGERATLAPVIPLFGSDVEDRDDDRHDADRDAGGDDACSAIERDIAERNLLKKLRVRSLSVSEARLVAVERDLDPATVDDVLADFVRRGYLDDAALAEQLVHAGSRRRGQGRQALAQLLAKRGIPRPIADAAIGALPDDDYERALDFARSRARSLRTAPPETALRRLAGQLSRRGYPGPVALGAAREALREAAAGS